MKFDPEDRIGGACEAAPTAPRTGCWLVPASRSEAIRSVGRARPHKPIRRLPPNQVAVEECREIRPAHQQTVSAFDTYSNRTAERQRNGVGCEHVGSDRQIGGAVAINIEISIRPMREAHLPNARIDY